MRFAVCSLLVLVCFGGASALAAKKKATASPVEKVIELLDGLKGKVAADLAKEEAAMGEYAQYCDNESSEKQYAIKSAGKQIEALLATIEDAQAEVVDEEDEISTLSTQIAKKESELAQAAKMRKADHEAFKKDQAELIDANDELERAEVVVKKEMSAAFLQGKAKSKQKLKLKDLKPADAKAIVNALAKVVDAAWIGQAESRTLKGFLQDAQQAGTDEEDKDLTMAKIHQEPAAEGEEGEGGVLQTLKDTEVKAADQLSTARKREMGAQHTFDMMKMSLEDGMKLLKTRLSDATASKASMEETIGQAKGEKAEAEKSKAADEEYLTSLTTNCKATSEAWERRQKDAADEMGAIDKAKEILASGVSAAAIQTQMMQISEPDADEDDSADQRTRHQVEQVLRRVGQEVHSFALTEMISAVAQDPFAKIKGLIDDMIAKLNEAAAEEADHKAFCDEELGKSRKSKSDNAMKMDKYRSRIDQAGSGKEELEETIKELMAEVAEIDATQAKATAQRNTEHSNFLQASGDFKASAEAVEKAMAVLSEYYGKSLVQTKAVAAVVSEKKQPKFGGGSSGDVASTILSILEVSASDFTRLLAEAEAEEEEAAAAYKKLTQENTLSKTAKQAEIRGKESEVKSLKVSLAHSNEDYKVVSKEYDAVVDYLDKLKPECETKAMSYEEKKARREAEVNGLKEALAIIEGRSVPGPELVQVKKHA